MPAMRWPLFAFVVIAACRAPAPAVPAPTRPNVHPAALTVPAPAAQNPSPMQENTRRHERLVERDDDGVRFSIDGLLPKSLEVFIPRRAIGAASASLVIHFMGATWVPKRAVATMERPVIMAATYLGGGSAVYERPFAADTSLYRTLVDSIRARVARIPGAPLIDGTYLSGWSAGYGAIREILRRAVNLPLVDGVVLIDGIHTSYLPERMPLAAGGALDTSGLAPFLAFAKLAVTGNKRFIITHSDIFPGTYASTTECTDLLLGALALKRSPVLEWGPMGAQLLSDTKRGRFEVLGFAGNTAPDHVDQFHGMATFLERLLVP